MKSSFFRKRYKSPPNHGESEKSADENETAAAMAKKEPPKHSEEKHKSYGYKKQFGPGIGHWEIFMKPQAESDNAVERHKKPLKNLEKCEKSLNEVMVSKSNDNGNAAEQDEFKANKESSNEIEPKRNETDSAILYNENNVTKESIDTTRNARVVNKLPANSQEISDSAQSIETEANVNSLSTKKATKKLLHSNSTFVQDIRTGMRCANKRLSNIKQSLTKSIFKWTGSRSNANIESSSQTHDNNGAHHSGSHMEAIISEATSSEQTVEAIAATDAMSSSKSTDVVDAKSAEIHIVKKEKLPKKLKPKKLSKKSKTEESDV